MSTCDASCVPTTLHTHVLLAQLRRDADFLVPLVVDETGGFHGQLRDDGTNYDPDLKHVVTTARFIFVFATLAALLDSTDVVAGSAHRAKVVHGLRFLLDVHIRRGTEYAHGRSISWTLRRAADGSFAVEDGSQYMYAVAFVLLALSTALTCFDLDDTGERSALDLEVRAELDAMWAFAEARFFDAEHRLYCDQFESSTHHLPKPYRGQNANMHTCEAFLAAWSATGEEKYIKRSYEIARRITVDLAIGGESGDGGTATPDIWEHFDETWAPDFEYNKEEPKGSEEYMFRPWGLQPGHFWEWSKLLVQLDTALAAAEARGVAIFAEGYPDVEGESAAWLLPRARDLYWRAVEVSVITFCFVLTFGSFRFQFFPPVANFCLVVLYLSLRDLLKFGWNQAGCDGAPGAAYIVHPTDARVLDSDRFYWVHNEMLAASGLLMCAMAKEARASRRGQNVEAFYNECWAFCQTYLVDQERGGWKPMYEVVDGVHLERVKQPFGLDADGEGGAERACVKMWPSKVCFYLPLHFK